MRFSSLTAAALTSASLASARIIGIAAPSTIAPSEPFTISLLTENYIQTVADISVAWGYTFSPYNATIGSFVSSAYLGPNVSNILTNISIPATAPAAFNNTSYLGKEITLTAAVTSLFGASGSVSSSGFEVSVLVGTETGDEIVTSDGFAWVK
ncbi:hypothetical protein P153DRAFT_390553 [Dothidotthia symphoricarpi CBS 119687]|uniref:Secreted protein NIS1 n=1 Tax=Dothidotthia symphoricarpi CBS 119687 TaxID=1392245 RepID=A0A6A5ZY93_9PLEO|nr:uncharacterized protein P153DRAFT_390553 [Dothidotthia symphoricarpi CBS 119687]KAF2124509.1 hypothetical protein P153DRAFT_390553 [Dothidotthia symphoricarpi CBS 119687]